MARFTVEVEVFADNVAHALQTVASNLPERLDTDNLESVSGIRLGRVCIEHEQGFGHEGLVFNLGGSDT